MTMVEEEIPIDYFYVEAESKDGKKSFLDRAQYKMVNMVIVIRSMKI